MTRSILLAAILALTAPLPAQTPEKGNWRPANKTAKSITGDLTLAPEKLTVDFVGAFPIAQIRPLTPAELAAAFEAEPSARGVGNLYRLSIPGSKKFLGKNSLCAGDDTQWMATYVVGKSLRLAFFSGATPPSLTPEAFANPTNLCGIYAYAR
jgi:hypothetical protein